MKTWKNHPQKLLIIGPHFFFSIANRPKTSPNLIFCSIKMSPCATSIYNEFVYYLSLQSFHQIFWSFEIFSSTDSWPNSWIISLHPHTWPEYDFSCQMGSHLVTLKKVQNKVTECFFNLFLPTLISDVINGCSHIQIFRF